MMLDVTLRVLRFTLERDRCRFQRHTCQHCFLFLSLFQSQLRAHTFVSLSHCQHLLWATSNLIRNQPPPMLDLSHHQQQVQRINSKTWTMDFSGWSRSMAWFVKKNASNTRVTFSVWNPTVRHAKVCLCLWTLFYARAQITVHSRNGDLCFLQRKQPQFTLFNCFLSWRQERKETSFLWSKSSFLVLMAPRPFFCSCDFWLLPIYLPQPACKSEVEVTQE